MSVRLGIRQYYYTARSLNKIDLEIWQYIIICVQTTLSILHTAVVTAVEYRTHIVKYSFNYWKMAIHYK